jgi:hypothetical protein
MKTDRRHALQTNWLADHLGRWLEKIKPYTNHIITGALVVVAGLAIWLVVARFWRADEEKTWTALGNYDSNTSRRISQETKKIDEDIQKKQQELSILTQRAPTGTDEEARKEHDRKIQALNDELEALRKERQNRITQIEDTARDELYRDAKDNIHMVAGQAAAFTAASRDFAEAADTVLTDPIGARQKLDRAAELFELIRDNTRDKLLRQRTKFQLARVYETRLRKDDQHPEKDDIALARREYEDLASQVPPSYCKVQAEERLAGLTPKTADSRAPRDPVYGWLTEELEKGRSSLPPLGTIGAGHGSDRPPPEID